MKRDRCPMAWHMLGATRGQNVTFSRGYTADRVVYVSAADVERVLGWNPDVEWDEWPDDMCATHDDVRRMAKPEQASKRHPAIKPNRRKTHR